MAGKSAQKLENRNNPDEETKRVRENSAATTDSSIEELE